jgi:4-amino-4-deoxy-L-arabinose transferase-like glycosyltransferase
VIAKERAWVDGLPILGGIWLLGAIVDRLWFAIDQSVPAWDQADYLTGVLNYGKALQHPQWFSGEWWTSFWMLSSKIPPFVYISTTPVISLFGGLELNRPAHNLSQSHSKSISIFKFTDDLYFYA